MSMWSVLVVLIPIWSGQGIAYGQTDGFQPYDVRISDDLDEKIFQLNEMEYYVDREGLISFEVVSSDSFNGFRRNPDYIKHDFNSDHTYWIRLAIKHNRETKQIWLLEFYDQTIDKIVAYLPLPNGSYTTKTMGDALSFEERPFKHKNFQIILDNNTSDVLTYYFKINSHESADIRVVVRSLYRFLFYATNEYFLFGLFYGIVFMIAFYNSLMFAVIKDRKYLIYIAYVLSVALYAASRDGLGYEFLWPTLHVWNQFSISVFIYAVVVWAVLFTRDFLKTREKFPALDNVLLGYLVLRTIFFVFALTIDRSLLQYRIIEIIPVFLILSASILILNRGYKPARFMVIAHSVLAFGFILKSLVDSGLFPFSIWSHYSLRVCIVVEMFFLTLALGDRVRIIKKKRDKALRLMLKEHEENARLRDKVTRELEEKVNERTIELNRKNELLEETNLNLIKQTKDINQINSVLDLENWKLKNNIKGLLQERLMQKDLSYEEFKELFPDDLSCLRYLENIKWGSQFKCKRCNNKKYFPGGKKFSRRCTRCGYDESVTAYTVFHGIKFPIVKGFFILYASTTQGSRYTLDELSRMLALRRNTIWSFKKKIQDTDHAKSAHSFRESLTDD